MNDMSQSKFNPLYNDGRKFNQFTPQFTDTCGPKQSVADDESGEMQSDAETEDDTQGED